MGTASFGLTIVLNNRPLRGAIPSFNLLGLLRGRAGAVIWLTGSFCDSPVLGADMRCELLVALLFIVHFHTVKCFANERP